MTSQVNIVPAHRVAAIVPTGKIHASGAPIVEKVPVIAWHIKTFAALDSVLVTPVGPKGLLFDVKRFVDDDTGQTISVGEFARG